MKKIKIAFIKFGGLASGGSEKWLQTVAANLPKKQFHVDYYYCDSAPYIGSSWVHPNTDPARLAYMESKKVNLIKFNVAAKNISVPTHDWLGTDFWHLFKEENYNVVATVRAGHKEYPYYLIKKTPIVELVTLAGHVDNQSNIVQTIHISNFQANIWKQLGGDPKRLEVIPLFSELPKPLTNNLRKELGLSDKQFVFGLHQRTDDGIYSEIPLEVYSKIETENTAFVLMGGSLKYGEQAKKLGLKNFYSIEPSGDYNIIGKFLATLDAYAHGRADGETYSLAIAEAMSYGLPIISHTAPAVGHIETIGDGGIVANSNEEYYGEMIKLMTDENYCAARSAKAFNRFNTELSLECNIQKLTELFKNIVKQKEIKEKLDTTAPDVFWDTVWNG